MTASVLDTPTVRVVLYEGRDAEALSPSRRFALIKHLLDAGLAVTTTASGADDVAPPDDSTLIVLGRFSGGAAPIAEDAAGRVTLRCIDLADDVPADVLRRIDDALADAEVQRNAPGRWKPWFPVIDYKRCTNCMQCLSFCLFDVYGVDDAGQIQVQHNDNCKTDCPACSRVCPEVAIMFPKYSAGPIHGGEVTDADVKREAMKVNISDLLGGDIYSRLRNRHAEAQDRFARERDEKQALSERMRCLAKIAKEMDIPMEALKSLPSQSEIREKAEAARAQQQ